MSTHPNAILMVILTPDNLTRRTHRDILSFEGVKLDEKIKIGDYGYNSIVMEDDYDEDNQISANEGDIVFYELITYGYGEYVEWNYLNKNKMLLEDWAKKVCNKFQCEYKIRISANYW